ncbi:MAG: glycogen synthase [Phycisphaerales bacterium]|nr:glycogen synthase [Phycisphaerales bacterium]
MAGNRNGAIPETDQTLALPEAALLFEVAWEVCAQAGGIYTVLRSKAPATVRRWEDRYFLIGPYREASARVELEPHPPSEQLAQVFAAFARTGVRLHFGRWLISGRPQVILVDLASLASRLAETKYFLWKDNGISSPAGDYEFDEIVLFGAFVTDFLQALGRQLPAVALLAHFHEWQGAAAVPRLRFLNARVATVFTTHATLAGRNLCAANANIYDQMGEINAGAIAERHGFSHRHALEGSAAVSADVFTTVSGITALEAEHFLGRRAEVLLPNGLNIERFAAPHEFQILHRECKQHIHEFVMGHFFPSYTFDLDRTLYLFTAGRYEYRNKGLDVFIEALYELNRRMRAENSPMTVVAFIITRAATRALNVETLNRQAMFNELRDTCQRIQDEMGQKLLHIVATGRLPSLNELLDEYATVRLKRMLYAWRSGPPPTIVTHDLIDDAHDPVLCHLRHRRLLNLESDRVKVVFHPDFLTATSPLLGMDYDQFVRGCHIGVFPSYYEPWGYTPLECVVRGVPAITSDLSGFGHYLMEHIPEHDSHGLFVCRRKGVNFNATVGQVVEWLHLLTQMQRRERIALRNKVESRGGHFDWNNLVRFYVDAHRLALERHYAGHSLIPADPDHDPEPRETPQPGPRPQRRRTTRAAAPRRGPSPKR